MIQPLREPDRARWTELWRAYLQFYRTTLPDDQYAHTWSRLMQGTALHGLAAHDGQRIVGIAHFLFHPSCWTMTDVCYLQDLYVDDAVRGQGTGRALIEAVAAAAREREAARLYWTTQDHNAAARTLYDKLAKHSGFIRYDWGRLATRFTGCREGA